MKWVYDLDNTNNSTMGANLNPAGLAGQLPATAVGRASGRVGQGIKLDSAWSMYCRTCTQGRVTGRFRRRLSGRPSLPRAELFCVCWGSLQWHTGDSQEAGIMQFGVKVVKLA